MNLISLYWRLVPKNYLQRESYFHTEWLKVSDPAIDGEQTKESMTILRKYIEPEMARRGL